MTPTHTTGQWTMEQGITHIKIWGEREKTGAVLVAEVRNEHGSHSTFGQEEKTNARLIAASPDLYEALKGLLPFIGLGFEADVDVYGVHHNDAVDALRIAEQAIAKAEGKG